MRTRCSRGCRTAILSLALLGLGLLMLSTPDALNGAVMPNPNFQMLRVHRVANRVLKPLLHITPGHTVLVRTLGEASSSHLAWYLSRFENYTRRVDCYAKRFGYEAKFLMGLNGTTALNASSEPYVNPYNLRVPLLSRELEDPRGSAEWVLYLDMDATMHNAPSVSAWVADIERGMNTSQCDVVGQDMGHIINSGVFLLRRGSPVALEFLREWWSSIHSVSGGVGKIGKGAVNWIWDQGPAMNAALRLFSRKLGGPVQYQDECIDVARQYIDDMHKANLCYRDWMDKMGFDPLKRAIGGLCFPSVRSPRPLRFQSHQNYPPKADDVILHGGSPAVEQFMLERPDLAVC